MSENDVAVAPAAVPTARKKKEQPKAKLPPVDLGPIQVLRHTGLAEWQWDAGTTAGLIPAADCDARWSVAVADQVAARRDEIVAVVGTEPPIGGHRAAERLAERTPLDLDALDQADPRNRCGRTGCGQYVPLHDALPVPTVDDTRVRYARCHPACLRAEQRERRSTRACPVDHGSQMTAATRTRLAR
ncbi:hypothetical protein ACIA5A_29125 [Micromonospora sp. NPDC051300]|uniref:hypothetical protein n=1 Tax=Micromonospora sp. NPDC051300 TaxID=3364286 RepID=UPI0037A773FA